MARPGSFSILLPDDVRQAVCDIAVRECRTMSEQIEYIVTKELKRMGALSGFTCSCGETDSTADKE